MKKQEFQIRTTNGMIPVTGYVEGTWSVHKHFIRDGNKDVPRYAITFLPLGLKLCDFYNLRPAKNFIQRLSWAVFPGKWDSKTGREQNIPKLKSIYRATLAEFPQYTSLSADLESLFYA